MSIQEIETTLRQLGIKELFFSDGDLRHVVWEYPGFIIYTGHPNSGRKLASRISKKTGWVYEQINDRLFYFNP